MLSQQVRLFGNAPGKRRRRGALHHRQSIGHNLLDGLVDFWPLSEQSSSRRGIHANLNLEDPNTAVTGADGVGSLASQFTSASSGYLARNSSTEIVPGDFDFSLGFWVYLDTTPATAMAIMTKADVSTVTNFGYYSRYLASTTNRFAFFVGDGSGLKSVLANTFGAASTATWYFVYCEHDATGNTIGISVNAGALDTTAHTTGVFASTLPIEFGRSQATAPQHLNGRMQRAFYATRRWTADERAYYFNGGRGRDYPFV